MKEIKLGTIGSGPIVHWMLDAVKMVESISCQAVYSRKEETGRALADTYGVEKVYTDLEEMLEDEELNFIYIASPNSLHYEQIKLALAHDKNVICEKPFCPRRSEVEEVIALAKEKHLFLVDAVPTAFLPNFEIVRQQLPKVGKIKLVLCNYSQYSSRYDQVLDGKVPNVFNPEFAGGCLQDINFYNVYFNVALFGKPLAAKYYPNIFPGLADTSGIMMMQYDGFVSSSAGAKDTWGVNYAQIEGEQGYIYIRDGSNGIAEVRVVTKAGEETLNLQDSPNRWYYEVQSMTKMILAGDYEKFYEQLDTTVDVITTIEEARKDAGILFPGD